MAKKKEPTVEEKLRALYDLQLIDSRIDKIRDVRGELPLEVRDLEDDIEGLNTRIEKVNVSLKELEDQISYKKNLIDEAKVLIKKYTEQQKNVRNNREFDSLTKETEYQELEIQLAEKNINEYKTQIELKKESIEEVETKLKDKSEHLDHKKKELDTILKETEKEENMLLKKSDDYKKLIEERLLFSYSKIRGNVKNGLAIVPVERGAAGGSYFTIPPQVQMEIASRKKIITDEHSGRILIDEALAIEQKEKMEKLFSSF
jgi:predicted  nucleic acid-binding Zn-ribbon protein